MVINTRNRTVSKATEVLFKGVQGNTWNVDTMYILNPSVSDVPVKLFFVAVDGDRSQILNITLEPGDQAILDTPASIRVDERIEIETIAGTQVTWRQYRFE